MATSVIESERIDYASILTGRTKALILAAVLLSMFLAALDQTIVATALPAIVVEFQGIDLLSWVSTSYLLASTTMVPIYGKLSDLYGRRTVLLAGIIIFLIGSSLCGIAGSMLQLIIFRAVQGIGSAALFSTAFAIPADLFPPVERARYQGLFGAVFGLSSVIGPYLGGLLTDSFSWRWVFYVNLPLGAVALVFILLKMPKLASGVRAPIDWTGAALLVSAVVPLLLGLTLDKELYPWTSPLILGLLVVATVATILFLLIELRAPSPIIPLELFRNRTFAIVTVVSLLNGAAFFAIILFLSIYMVNVVGVSATEAGTTLIPLTLALVVGSIISSIIVQRIGRYKPIIVTGFAILTAGLWLLSGMDVDTTRWGVVWRMIVVGLGMGPGLPLLNLALQNAVPFAQVGASTASRQFFQQIGQTFGAAIFGVVLSASLTTQLNTRFAPILEQVPAEMRSQVDPSQFRNGSAGAETSGAGQIDIANEITGGIASSFDQQRELVTAAIREDNQQARAELLDNPETPRQLKELLSGPALPLKQREQALEGVLSGLNTAEGTAIEQGRSISVQIGQVLRQSFAASITQIYFYAIFPVAIAFLLLVVGLPEIPLRTTNRDEAPTPAFE